MRKGFHVLGLVSAALLSVAAALLSVAVAAAARGGMPAPLTERGQVMADIYYWVFLAAAVVFLIVFSIMVYILWRYRESTGQGRATYERERENIRLEMLWIIIPLIVVLGVGWVGYVGMVELDGIHWDGEGAMEVKITGSQWNWEADYGDGVRVFADPGPLGRIADDHVFVLPERVPVIFNITSVDVIHSFYLQDENRGHVGLIDANPSGPHKYNHFPIREGLPAGEYHVQCKEYCLNPGHAYMRARIVVVPQDDYDQWFKQRSLEGVCSPRIIDHMGIEVLEGNLTVTGVDEDGPPVRTAVLDACIIARVTNTLDREATLSIDGLQEQATVGPGAEVFWLFNATQGGTFPVVSSEGGAVDLEVVEAEVVRIGLGDRSPTDMYLDPEVIRVEAGTTYLFQMENIGSATHNLFIGVYGDDDEGVARDVLARSVTVQPGQSTSFVWTPEEATEWQMWCGVPGHYHPGGMSGTVIVA